MDNIIIKFKCPRCGAEKLDLRVRCEASETNATLIAYCGEVIVDRTGTLPEIDHDTIEELFYECGGCSYCWDTMEELADDNALLNSDGTTVDAGGNVKGSSAPDVNETQQS